MSSPKSFPKKTQLGCFAGPWSCPFSLPVLCVNGLNMLPVPFIQSMNSFEFQYNSFCATPSACSGECTGKSSEAILAPCLHGARLQQAAEEYRQLRH